MSHAAIRHPGLGDRWGAEDSPSGYDLMYQQSFDSIAPGIVTTAASVQQFGESLADTILRIANTWNMNRAQQELLEIQLSRARQGLPPLTGSQYGLPMTGQGMAGDSKLILFGLFALGAILLLKKG